MTITALIFLGFILQKEWLCLSCQTQRAALGQLGDPAPPTPASPKKQAPAPAAGSSSTPAALDSKPVVEPPPPPGPEAKVVPLTLPEPDAVSSCSVSEPPPGCQPKEQKDALADEKVSDVKQPEPSSSENQDPPLPVEGDAENQSAMTGLDATAAPAEVKTEPQISQSVASPSESLKVEPEPENSPDVAEEPRRVSTTDAGLQEVPPQALAETESQATAAEQEEPEPVRDGAVLREGTPPPPPPFGEEAEAVANVVSRTAEAQQEPKPDSNPTKCEESQTSSESEPFKGDGELQEPEPPEEVKDLRDVTEQNNEENKVSMAEESAELKIAPRVDEKIKATENGAEEKTVWGKVSEPIKVEAGRENKPSKASEEQLVPNNAASENVNEVKADEGKPPERETAEEKQTNDQKASEEKVNIDERSQTPSNGTENIRQEEKERNGPALTAAEEIPKDETQKTIKTESETVSMAAGDKHRNRNSEESAQMASDVIKAKMSEDAPIQGGSETCSQHTNCNESQKEAERGEEELERGTQEKVPVKDEEGQEVASQIQETVSETQKSAGGDEGGTASPDCSKEEISNQETTGGSFEGGDVAKAVESVAEPQILLGVANEQGEESQEKNIEREEPKEAGDQPKEAEDQPLGMASDGETVTEVTVEFSK